MHVCASCAAEVPAEYAFCGCCGARVQPELARSDRRTVTVVFADLSGFTSLGTQLDPEELTRVTQGCFRALMEEVRVYGGWLEKHIGDAILAVFGAPIVHEDDPIRAVRAALAMQQRMSAANARVESTLGRPLELHVGVNTGLVVMAPGIDSDELVVVGDTVNTGKRLQEGAAPGELLVGEATYEATRWAFEYRRLTPLQAKGKPDLAAFACIGMRARASAGRRGGGLRSALVGRDTELAALARAVDGVVAGGGVAVAIVGDAGVGKSRLVDEVGRRARDKRIRRLEGRSLSFTQSISYWPFIEAIRGDAEIGDDSDEAAWEKLRRRVEQVAPDAVADLLPYLATLVGIPVRGELSERVMYLDADALRRQIFRTSRRWLERLASVQPLALVFEDWHWADESSHELLEHILPLIESSAIAVCCICRPDRDTPAARFRERARTDHPDRYVEIALASLSPGESAELVGNLFGTDELPPRIRDLVFRKGEGNPFFMEEIVRSLIDLRVVARDDAFGRWRIAEQGDEVSIPDTLRGVIVARIDRLEPDVKEVLRIASVIGRVFTRPVLETLAGAEIAQHLAVLQERELIREREPEGEYAFRHAVTHEAVYESILLERRRELHRRVGESLEALFTGRLEDLYGVLALHFARAEDWERAQEYLLLAGDQAGKIAADTEALAHYRAAITAYSRAVGDRWSPLQRAQLDRKIGEALFRRGRHEEAEEHLQRALGYLGGSLPARRSGWRVRLPIARHLLQQAGHRLAPRLLVRLDGPVDPAREERAYIYDVMNWIDFFVDQERFVLDALLELNVSERSGYLTGTIRASFAVGVLFDTVPLSRLAARYHRRAIALAEESGNPALVSEASMRLAMHRQFVLGDWAGALELHDRAANGFREVGNQRGWAAVSLFSSQIVGARGDLERSLELADEVIRVGEDAADGQVWAWGLGESAAALRRHGDVEESIERASRSAAMFEQIPDYLSMASVLGHLGLSRLAAGDLPEALQALERARDLIDERSLRAFLCSPAYHGLSAACLAFAEQSHGAERSAWLRRSRRACRAEVRQGKLDRGALVAAYRNRGTYAWLRGRSGRARTWWRRSIDVAEQLGARYELAVTQLELGARTGEVEPIESSAATFAEVGARRELLRADELLGRSAPAREGAPALV